jgi:hypothetical protein
VTPSNPQVGLNYGGVDLSLGISHLQLLGVRYYLAFSPSIVAQARYIPDLVPVAVSPAYAGGATWHVYLIRNAPMVTPLTNLPNVLTSSTSRAAWLAANETWWLDQSRWPVPLAASGPSNWPRTSNPNSVTTTRAPSTSVTDVQVGDQSISFHVSRIGTPVEVRISYYPRWHVTGATGPYRVSPNLMVVVPTSNTVTLTYGSSPALDLGRLITLVTAIAGLVVLWRARWWRRPTRLADRLEDR